MKDSRRRRVVGLALATVFLLLGVSPPLQSLANAPREVRLLLGEEQRLALVGLPVPVVVRADRDGLLTINDQAPAAGRWRVSLASPLALRPLSPGRCRLSLSLFGLVPLRSIAVEVMPRLEVVPGGQSIGILLRTRGVSVVGYAPVEGSDGQSHFPAREAGVKVGDIILRIDGVEVKSGQHVVFLVNRCAREGRAVPVEVGRGVESLSYQVRPLYSEKEGIFQLGLYVRDGAAGVGTLTFYEPGSRVFMALGHVIADSTTNQPLHVSDGRVVRADVARVRPGKRGEPGEKEGTFIEDRDVVGAITANTDFGLVGVATDPREFFGTETLPVALAREVVVGPAEIRTVVDGTRVESFAAEIIRTDPGRNEPTPKGITIRVTDPALLGRTGGIVQGMSGSPILQNGRLVGAITHVFVNDPTRGYGVFAEWMVEEAGLVATPVGRTWTPLTARLAALGSCAWEGVGNRTLPALQP